MPEIHAPPLLLRPRPQHAGAGQPRLCNIGLGEIEAQRQTLTPAQAHSRLGAEAGALVSCSQAGLCPGPGGSVSGICHFGPLHSACSSLAPQEPLGQASIWWCGPSPSLPALGARSSAEVSPLDPNNNPILWRNNLRLNEKCLSRGCATQHGAEELLSSWGPQLLRPFPTSPSARPSPDPGQTGPVPKAPLRQGWDFSKGILLRKLGGNSTEIE